MSTDISREDLISQLRKRTIRLEFTKKNGENRVMTATLTEDIIPEDLIPRGNSSVKDNGDTIRVFDVENNGWRSFNFSTLINAE